MPKTGRPKGPRIRVPCSAGEKCKFAVDGVPGIVEKYPSALKTSKTGRLFHDAECRNAVGGRVAHPKTGICQNPNHPTDTPRVFTYAAKLVHRDYCCWDCYVDVKRAKVVTSPCAWCGLPIVAAESKNRKYHETEAPEPDCGWPEGVRMTCTQLGQYKNLVEPLRFVNGKPVRMWLDRRFEDATVQRPQVWDPNKGENGDWEFEHRYLWQQAHGVPLGPDVHIHHVDENKLNNDLSNLQELTPSQHLALHNAERIGAAAEVERLRRLLAEHGIEA